MFAGEILYGRITEKLILPGNIGPNASLLMYVCECKCCMHTPALWGFATSRYGLDCNAMNINFILFIYVFYKNNALDRP